MSSTTNHLTVWLSQLGLGYFAENFIRAGYGDLNALLSMSDTELSAVEQAVGLQPAHARVLKTAIANIQAASNGSVSVSSQSAQSVPAASVVSVKEQLEQHILAFPPLSLSDFSITGPVSESAHGVVLSARCIRSGLPDPQKQYALKVFPSSENAALEHELRTVTRLPCHPFIIRTWSIFNQRTTQMSSASDQDGLQQPTMATFIVQDFFKENLAQLSSASSSVPLAFFLRTALCLSEALMFLRNQGIVHPVLFPHHVSLTSTQHPAINCFKAAVPCAAQANSSSVSLSCKAIDWVTHAISGCAVELAQAHAKGLSVGGDVSGLPGTIPNAALQMTAPEIVNSLIANAEAAASGADNDGSKGLLAGSSQKMVDVGSQVTFLAGMLLYYLASGKHPLPGYPSQFRMRLGSDQKPQPSNDPYAPVYYESSWLPRLPPQYPDQVDALLRRMLALNPSDRPRVDAVVTAFTNLGAARVCPPPPPPLPSRLLLTHVTLRTKKSPQSSLLSFGPEAESIFVEKQCARVVVPVWPDDLVGSVTRRAAFTAGFGKAAQTSTFLSETGSSASLTSVSTDSSSEAFELVLADGTTIDARLPLSQCASRLFGPAKVTVRVTVPPIVSGAAETGLAGLGLGGISLLGADVFGRDTPATITPSLGTITTDPTQASFASIGPDLTGVVSTADDSIAGLNNSGLLASSVNFDAALTSATTSEPLGTDFLAAAHTEAFVQSEPSHMPSEDQVDVSEERQFTQASRNDSTASETAEDTNAAAVSDAQATPVSDTDSVTAESQSSAPATTALPQSAKWANIAAAPAAVTGNGARPSSRKAAAPAPSPAPTPATAVPSAAAARSTNAAARYSATPQWRTVKDVDLAKLLQQRLAAALDDPTTGAKVMMNLRDGMRELQDRTHTRDESMLVNLGKLGYVDAALTGLRLGTSRDSSIASYSLQTIGNLAMQDQNRRDIADKEGIRMVVECMRAHEDNTRVQKDAVVALRHIAYENDENKSLIVKLGGVDAVVDAMVNCEDNAHVQRQCCGALSIFAVHSTQGEEAKARITEVGGVEAVLKTIEVHSTDTAVLIAAVKALGTIAHFTAARDIARKAGGIELCESLVEEADYSGNKQLQDVLRQTLRRLR